MDTKVSPCFPEGTQIGKKRLGENPSVAEVASLFCFYSSYSLNNFNLYGGHMIRYVSAFRGMGGVEKALEQIGGFQSVGEFEIDRHANLFSENYYERTMNHGNITTTNASEVADHSWLIGGFCCQPFSVAGIRQGFKDKTRGTVFFDLARIIEAKQPEIVVLENVRGLVSHAQGQTLSIILNTLGELGYRCEWGLLNSKDYGVPHHRVRWYCVARHTRTRPSGTIFPLGQSNKEDTRRAGEHLSYCLDANYWKGTNTTLKGRRQLIQINKPTHSNNRVYDPDGLSPTLNTMQGGNRQPFITTDDARVRRLTPLECFRLQGFPDDAYHKAVELGISNTQMYKMCGNAITVPVFKALAERILEVTNPPRIRQEPFYEEDRCREHDKRQFEMFSDPDWNYSGMR